MMRSVTALLRRFRRTEEGHVTVEFAIMVPVLLVFLFSAVELGMMTMRNVFLERALDLSVRHVRLNTGGDITHDSLKTMICDEMNLPDCSNNLKLEMIRRDLRNWQDLPTQYTCSDRSEEVQPVTEFSLGTDNELMILRACAKFEPLFPTTGFANALTKDAAGDVALMATSAFVQEPK